MDHVRSLLYFKNINVKKTWFQVAFKRQEPDDVREFFETDENFLISKQGHLFRYNIGECTTPTLGELRNTVLLLPRSDKPNVDYKIIDDIFYQHAQCKLYSTFQVQSSMEYDEKRSFTNLYEPETQGSASSLAVAPAAIYRLMKMGKNLLEDAVSALKKNINIKFEHGRPNKPTAREIQTFGEALFEENDKNIFRDNIRIGLHSNIEVIFKSRQNNNYRLLKNPLHLITQAVCLAVDLSDFTNTLKSWETIAVCVLEAMYEATIYAAYLNAVKHNFQQGSNIVYLTYLGTGTFFNRNNWIRKAMMRAVAIAFKQKLNLNIIIVSKDLKDVESAKLLSILSVESKLLNQNQPIIDNFPVFDNAGKNLCFFHAYVQCIRAAMIYTYSQLFKETNYFIIKLFDLFLPGVHDNSFDVLKSLVSQFTDDVKKDFLDNQSIESISSFPPNNPKNLHQAIFKSFGNESPLLKLNFTNQNVITSARPTVKDSLESYFNKLDLSRVIIIEIDRKQVIKAKRRSLKNCNENFSNFKKITLKKPNLMSEESSLFEKKDFFNVKFELVAMITRPNLRNTNHWVAYVFYKKKYTLLDDIGPRQNTESIDKLKDNEFQFTICFYRATIE